MIASVKTMNGTHSISNNCANALRQVPRFSSKGGKHRSNNINKGGQPMVRMRAESLVPEYKRKGKQPIVRFAQNHD